VADTERVEPHRQHRAAAEQGILHERQVSDVVLIELPRSMPPS
jgi:hypothetical protein